MAGNHLYFNEFAEMTIRPYLQVLAEKAQNQIDSCQPGGEPVRRSPKTLSTIIKI